MTKLYQLPNKSWIDPTIIESIAVRPAEEATGIHRAYPHRVTVSARYSFYHTIECETLEEAEELAAKIGREANLFRHFVQNRGLN